MKRFLILGALVGTIFISACDEPQSQNKVRKSRIPSNDHAKRDLPKLEVIQNLVSRNCSCRMAGRDTSAIARRLAEVVKGLKTEGLGTASVPLSFEITCYPELGPKACTSDGARVVSDGDVVCTAEQIKELEELWNRTMPPAGGSTAKADAAVTRRISEMQAATRRNLSQSDCE